MEPTGLPPTADIQNTNVILVFKTVWLLELLLCDFKQLLFDLIDYLSPDKKSILIILNKASLDSVIIYPNVAKDIWT